MTLVTIRRLRPLLIKAYCAARTRREEGLVAILMAFVALHDPYTGARLRGSAHRPFRPV